MGLKLLKNVRLKKKKRKMLESGSDCEKKEETFTKVFSYR